MGDGPLVVRASALWQFSTKVSSLSTTNTQTDTYN